MLGELIRAFFLVFIAEMGDKTQIIAMTFATQYKVAEVLLGVLIGVVLNHGIAIALGSYLSEIIPMNLIQIIAGALFVVFGILSLREGEEDGEKENKKKYGPIATVAVAFFVGELGDKTQLTAMTLATEGRYPIFILMGTTLGMLATSGLGIFVGSKIGEKVPDILIKVISSFVFLFFGTLKLFQTVPARFISPLTIAVYFIVLSLIVYMLMRKLFYNRNIGKKSVLKEVAATLYVQSQELSEAVKEICLGEGKCGTCKGEKCPVGFTKDVLANAVEEGEYFSESDFNNYSVIKEKKFDRNKVIEALSLILADYMKYGIEKEKNFVVNKTRETLEMILFGKNIPFKENVEEYLAQIRNEDEYLAQKISKRVKEISK